MTNRSRLSQSQKHTGRVVFFGSECPNDELRDVFRRLLLHAKDRRFPLLAAFIKESTRVLKGELELLPCAVRDQVPHFENILHLPEYGNFQEGWGSLGAAMKNAFLVIFQVGTLIGHHEINRLGLDLAAPGSLASGLSIGLLSAAALSTATTLPSMVETGARSLRVAFRLGLYVQEFSQKLESSQPDGNLPQSWAYVVTGMSKTSVGEELSKYNAQNGVSDLSKVFISAVDKASVDVTGPPSQLRAAFDYSQSLRDSNSFPLPVYDGVYHASHIYTAEDVEEIVAGSLDAFAAYCNSYETTNVPLTSPKHGTPFACRTAPDLLRSICTELLTGKICLDKITAAIARHFSGDGLSSCTFDTFRTSSVTKSVIDGINTALSHHTLLDVCDMVSWVFQDYGPRQPASTSDAKLAIVGMACRLPGGSNDPDQFWKFLEKGDDACVRVPSDQFNPTGDTGKTAQTEYGNFIDHPGCFDAGFFAMSPKQVERADPMVRLALVTGYEAMEMAGIVPGRTMSSKATRIATYFDQGNDGWSEYNPSHRNSAVPGGFHSFGTAVDAGCTALWTGEVDTVIAGGASLITDLDERYDLSRTGQSKIWDKDADGHCPGEGVGAVVIKRLEDAEADNDNILAVVLSAATNYSADAKSSPRPHGGAQEAIYRQVLCRAGAHPFDVSFVEMHGTCTQAGDAIEAESVLSVFAPKAIPRRRPNQRLYLGAVKSNMGHGGAAAGISSLIKTLLCFEHDKIPPHVGIKTVINPAIPRDLARRQVALAGAKTQWPGSGSQKRLAMVNSFGSSGGDSSLLLENRPEKRLSSTSSNRVLNPFVFSAQSLKSLRANLENMVNYLDQHPDTHLGSLSYTLSARRLHHDLRVATTANSVEALHKFIKSSLETELSDIHPVSTDRPSVIFTFTGEGSAYSGSPNLFAECASFRRQVIQLDAIVRRLGFNSVIPVMNGSASKEYATHPIVSQQTIVVLEIALARYWMTMGIQPSMVAGHSLGEYSAMAVAGILSASDALFLVGRRAQLTLDRCVLGSYSMLSTRASAEEIRTSLKQLKEDPTTANVSYEIACQNGEKDTVLGAPKGDIAVISRVLKAAGHKCIELAMPFAYHTAQMDAIVTEFYSLACNTPFKVSSIPYISALLGEVIPEGKGIDADYMRRQTRETVNFIGAINAAMKSGIANERTVWIDIGPHPICAGFLKAAVPGSIVLSSCRRNEETVETLTKSLVQLHLAGLEPTWNEHFRDREDCFTVLKLPKYSWDEVDYGTTSRRRVLPRR